MDDFSTPGQANDFDLPPTPENFIQPHKRPMSSMSPMILVAKGSGDVRLVVGGAGGSRIISAIAYVTSQVLWYNQTVKEAIDRPRLHNQFSPNQTNYEGGFPTEYLEELVVVHGQTLKQDNPREISVVTAIARLKDGTLAANSDFRKPGGYPSGF